MSVRRNSSKASQQPIGEFLWGESEQHELTVSCSWRARKNCREKVEGTGAGKASGRVGGRARCSVLHRGSGLALQNSQTWSGFLPMQLEPSWSEWCRTLVVLAHQSEE